MNEKPIVSVIVPVYKVEKYLAKCLDSLLAQTLRDIEIVVVDDGSPDSCPDMIDAYAQRDNRIKAIHISNGGVSHARNVGLDASTGKFIGFVDSDDYVESDMYEIMSSISERYCADIVQCSSSGLSEEGGLEIFRSSGSMISGFMDGRIGNNVWSKLYRRSLIGDVRFPVGWRFAEDFRFNGQLVLKCRKLICVNKGFYHYMVRNDSVTHEHLSDDFLKGFSVYDDMKSRFQADSAEYIAISRKEESESLRFLNNSIGLETVSEQSLNDLLDRISRGRRFIKGNGYMSFPARLAARFACAAPGTYIALEKLFKRMRGRI